MMDPNLENPRESTSPRQARRQFLNARKGEFKESTNRAYEYPTKNFVEFCEEYDIGSIGEVNNYVLESWKESRKKDDIKIVTVHNNVKHVRVFIRWCEKNGLVDKDTADTMSIPNLSKSDAVSDTKMSLEQAEQSLRYLAKYEYASRQHAVLFTLWETGCRASGAVSLDVCDFEIRREGGVPSTLKFRDREATGTALKNGATGERNVNVSNELQNVLIDYIKGQREPITDEYDREPLFTTRNGRIYRQRMYKNVVGYTRPCLSGNSCPHDRSIEDCRAAQSKKQAAQCPSSVSTHPVRRGAITYHLKRDWPKEKVSEKMDVSVDILDKHYDARTKQEEQEGRQQFLDLL